jgi:hypothetical protein
MGRVSSPGLPTGKPVRKHTLMSNTRTRRCFMRSLFLSLVLGVTSLGVIGITPSSADAAWWRRGYAYYPAYTYPGYSSYYASPYAYSSPYTYGYSYAPYGYSYNYNYSYYPGYSRYYYAPTYSTPYYPTYYYSSPGYYYSY